MESVTVDYTIPDGIYGNLLVHTDFSRNYLYVVPEGFKKPCVNYIFNRDNLEKLGAVLVFESDGCTGWESHWWKNRWIKKGPWQKDFKKLLAKYTRLNNINVLNEIKRKQQVLDSYSSK